MRQIAMKNSWHILTTDADNVIKIEVYMMKEGLQGKMYMDYTPGKVWNWRRNVRIY